MSAKTVAMKLERQAGDEEWWEPFGPAAKTPHAALEVLAVHVLVGLENGLAIEPGSLAHKHLRAILIGIQERS